MSDLRDHSQPCDHAGDCFRVNTYASPSRWDCVRPMCPGGREVTDDDLRLLLDDLAKQDADRRQVGIGDTG